MAASRTCKVCNQTMEATRENWVWNHGKPNGLRCRVCHNAANKLHKQQLVTLETGEIVTLGAAQKRKHLAIPENRAKQNASSVESYCKRLRSDAWFRLKRDLANRTNELVHYLVAGTGHRADWSLFGATRQTVFDKIDAQLKTRGFAWQRYGEQWVLDHRLPLAIGQSDLELYQLCRLDNCQVLTPAENQKKGVEDQKLVKSYQA